MDLMRFMRDGVEDSRLRPLLCMAGGAAAVAGVYSYIKRREKSTSDPESTAGAEDPMRATELNLVQHSECPQAQVMDTVNEARERIEMLMVANAQLLNKVKELERVLSEARRDADMKSKQCERDQKAHTTLKAEKDEIQKTLILKEELLKVTLAKAQEKEKKAVESITLLKAEKSELTNEVKELQSTVEKLGNLLDKNQGKCEDLMNKCERELEAHTILLAENAEMMRTLIQKEKLLKVTRADAEKRQQKDVKAIAVLEAEKSDLIDKVKRLQSTVEDLGNQLYKTQHEHKQEQEAYTILQAEKDEIKMLVHNEEILKLTLAEAQEKQQKAVESITSLETERSDLMDKVKELQRKCEDLMNECEQERAAHTILLGENEEIKETLIQQEELLKISVANAKVKEKKAEEAIANLEAEKSELIAKAKKKQSTMEKVRNALYKTEKKYEDLTNLTLADAQEKQQIAVESITRLETERSELMDRVKELQSTVEKLGNLVHKNQRRCQYLMNECEREPHSILHSENEEIKKTLLQDEQLLKVTLVDGEKKQQKDVEAIVVLEVERSDLIKNVIKLQSTAKDRIVSKNGRLTPSSRQRKMDKKRDLPGGC